MTEAELRTILEAHKMWLTDLQGSRALPPQVDVRNTAYERGESVAGIDGTIRLALRELMGCSMKLAEDSDPEWAALMFRLTGKLLEKAAQECNRAAESLGQC